MTPDNRFRSGDGQTHLVKNNLVSVGVNKCITNTYENTVLPSRLMNVVSDIQDILGSINDRPEMSCSNV